MMILTWLQIVSEKPGFIADLVTDISIKPLIVGLLLVLATYLLFRGLNLYIRNRFIDPIRLTRRQILMRYSEFSSYGLIAIIVLYYYISNQSGQLAILLLILTGILVTASWKAVQDVTAGIIIKLEQNLQIGRHISVDDTVGIIDGIGWRSIQIQTETGRIKTVPFTTLLNAEISAGIKIDQSYPVGYQITISNGDSISKIISTIKIIAATSIWADQHVEPAIQILKHQQNLVEVSITVYTYTPDYRFELLDDLARKLELYNQGKLIPLVS